MGGAGWWCDVVWRGPVSASVGGVGVACQGFEDDSGVVAHGREERLHRRSVRAPQATGCGLGQVVDARLRRGVDASGRQDGIGVR